MGAEQLETEDYKLFELKKYIHSLVREYNIRRERLEKEQPSKFEEAKGLILISKELGYCL